MKLEIKSIDIKKDIVYYSYNNSDYEYHVKHEIVYKKENNKNKVISLKDSEVKKVINLLKIQCKSFKEYNKNIK